MAYRSVPYNQTLKTNETPRPQARHEVPRSAQQARSVPLDLKPMRQARHEAAAQWCTRTLNFFLVESLSTQLTRRARASRCPVLLLSPYMHRHRLTARHSPGVDSASCFPTAFPLSFFYPQLACTPVHLPTLALLSVLVSCPKPAFALPNTNTSDNDFIS